MLTVANPIDDVLAKVEDYLDRNGVESFAINLERLVRRVHHEILGKSDKGWCMRFSVPEKEVTILYDAFDNVTRDEIKAAFLQQWGVTAAMQMFGHIYYHNLCLSFLYGVRHNNDKIVTNALQLLLFRVWNGRLYNAIQYCNEDVMLYVTTVVMNKKFIPHKFETPFDAIRNHFTPTIIKKYAPAIIANSSSTKRLFEQVYGRIWQLFYQDGIRDLKTGKTVFRSGLAPLYYKAKAKGQKIGTTSNQGGIGDSVDDAFSSHSFDENIEAVTLFIIHNNPSTVQYPKNFIDFLFEETKNKPNNIEIILKSLHKMDNVELIREIVELMFRRFQSQSIKKTICSKDFLSTIVKKKIISSKHTPDVNTIKQIVDKLLDEIMATAFSRPYVYRDYQETQRAQLRRIIIYGIAYNLQKQVCFR